MLGKPEPCGAGGQAPSPPQPRARGGCKGQRFLPESTSGHPLPTQNQLSRANRAPRHQHRSLRCILGGTQDPPRPVPRAAPAAGQVPARQPPGAGVLHAASITGGTHLLFDLDSSRVFFRATRSLTSRFWEARVPRGEIQEQGGAGKAAGGCCAAVAPLSPSQLPLAQRDAETRTAFRGTRPDISAAYPAITAITLNIGHK